MQRKKLDMIVANQVGEGKAFDKDTNQVDIIWHDGQQSIPEKNKNALAVDLMKLITQQYTQSS